MTTRRARHRARDREDPYSFRRTGAASHKAGRDLTRAVAVVDAPSITFGRRLVSPGRGHRGRPQRNGI